MSAAAVFAVVAVASTAITISAQQQEEEAQQRALEATAERKEVEAKETIERGLINARVIEREYRQQQGEAISGFAKAGIDISGSTLIALEQDAMVAAREQLNNKRETEFRAQQLRWEAKQAKAGISGIEEAVPLRRAGAIAEGVGGVARAYGRGRYGS